MTFKEAILGMYSKNTWKAAVKHKCPQCGVFDFPAIEISTGNNAIKGTCIECGSYIKFIPQGEIVLVKKGRQSEATT